MKTSAHCVLLAILAGSALPALGAGLVVYEHADFRGDSRRIDGEVRELRDIGFRDRISSFRVESGSWEMCTDSDFRGRCQVFDHDMRNLQGTGLNDEISSIRPVRRERVPDLGRDVGRIGGGRPEITLFERTGFRGESRRYDGPTDNLNERGFNDRAMSARVVGSWELCADADFRGRCQVLDRDVADLTDVELDRSISSLRPAGEPGDRGDSGRGRGDFSRERGQAAITVFEHAGHRGRNRTFDGPVRDLKGPGFNDMISSLRISSGSWELCEHSDFRGRCEVFDGDVANLKDVDFNDAVSSLRPVGNGGGTPWRNEYSPIVVFQDARYEGRSRRFWGDVPDLRELGFAKTISSVRIERGTWELCEAPRYEGRCLVLHGDAENLRDVGFNDRVSSIRRVQ